MPVAAILVFATAAPGGEWTFECLIRGERMVGTPLAWSETGVDVLTRDGAWEAFDLDDAGFESVGTHGPRGLPCRGIGAQPVVAGDYLLPAEARE